MQTLRELLKGLNPTQIIGKDGVRIQKIEFDSRKSDSGSLFVAIKGTQSDGHQFIEKATANGAAAVVCEVLPETLAESVTYVQVADSTEALGWLASRFFDHPSQKLQLVGVTGTNGKTTTVTLLYQLFMGLGYKTGLLSTVENKIGSEVIPATHTTPDAVSLNALLAKMVERGCDFAFMEVSSHAVEQRRIAGLHFAGGVFTNITHDHLDYHKTFKNYLNAKKKFFDNLPKTAFALTNLDDRNGRVMLQNTPAKTFGYALKTMADFKAKIMSNALAGLHLDLDGFDFYSRLIGGFNAYNLLAVYGTAVLLGQDKTQILTVLSNLKTAEGRFDYIVSKTKNIVAIVDYAHTPDALEKVLTTINDLKDANSKVITVVGCGGDRDKEKRPIMAKIASQWSDHTILTSDNPRSEDPEAILEDMQRGVLPTAMRKTLVITDRRQAIKTACNLANEADILLVAGKGHEKYQEIKGVKHPFDDKEELKKYLNDEQPKLINP